MLKFIAYLVAALVAFRLAIWLFRYARFRRLEDPALALAGEPAQAISADLDGARELADVLEPIRRRYKLPAIAAAIVKEGRTAALGAVGVRRAGGREPVTVHDRFHIGSCTKSMTATLCAILVQQGKLKWDSTIGEVFSDEGDRILPEYHAVTLEQLLAHRGGLPEDREPDRDVWPKICALSGPMLDQRRELVALVLQRPPAAAPGSRFQYSNNGYAVAGAMCERATDKTWEELIREHLFTPLSMTSVGFGPPGTPEAVDQPWGHLVNASTWKPMPPGPDADNPAVIGPAGTVHCSLADWAKYASLHVRGARGEESLLPDDVLRKLHTPTDGEYAFGWIVAERDWAGGTTLTHGGSNTMWCAVLWLAPKRDWAYLAATNVGTNKGFEGCDAAIGKLLEITESL